MDDRTIGQRIAGERKKLGLSQEQLGEKTGVSRQAISKWEADSAIPEIDKLISLSRLFEVSIGWLLGVEETPAAQKDELSETQMKTVEEMIKHYQPNPTGSRLLITLVAILGIAAVCIVSIFTRPVPSDYSGQIDAIHQENLRIRSQLNTIYGQLETIKAGLSNYELSVAGVSPEYANLFIPLEPTVSLGTATIRLDPDTEFVLLSFGAVPQNYDETVQVFLGVYFNNRIVSKIPLEWVDGVYQGIFSLPLEDGYEYWFIREFDGIEQWHALTIPGYSDLTEAVQNSGI